MLPGIAIAGNIRALDETGGHPMGEARRRLVKRENALLAYAEVQTVAGKVQVRWETDLQLVEPVRAPGQSAGAPRGHQQSTVADGGDRAAHRTCRADDPHLDRPACRVQQGAGGADAYVRLAAGLARARCGAVECHDRLRPVLRLPQAGTRWRRMAPITAAVPPPACPRAGRLRFFG